MKGGVGVTWNNEQFFKACYAEEVGKAYVELSLHQVCAEYSDIFAGISSMDS